MGFLASVGRANVLQDVLAYKTAIRRDKLALAQEKALNQQVEFSKLQQDRIRQQMEFEEHMNAPVDFEAAYQDAMEIGKPFADRLEAMAQPFIYMNENKRRTILRKNLGDTLGDLYNGETEAQLAPALYKWWEQEIERIKKLLNPPPTPDGKPGKKPSGKELIALQGELQNAIVGASKWNEAHNMHQRQKDKLEAQIATEKKQQATEEARKAYYEEQTAQAKQGKQPTPPKPLTDKQINDTLKDLHLALNRLRQTGGLDEIQLLMFKDNTDLLAKIKSGDTSEAEAELTRQIDYYSTMAEERMILTTRLAKRYAERAGGDKEKAREMARKDGYKF